MNEITCPKCGNKAPADAVFCPNCGVPLNVKSTQQTTPLVVTTPTLPGIAL